MFFMCFAAADSPPDVILEVCSKSVWNTCTVEEVKCENFGCYDPYPGYHHNWCESGAWWQERTLGAVEHKTFEPKEPYGAKEFRAEEVECASYGPCADNCVKDFQSSYWYCRIAVKGDANYWPSVSVMRVFYTSMDVCLD